MPLFSIPSKALAFKHLDSEVTSVKVAFFREALIEVAPGSAFREGLGVDENLGGGWGGLGGMGMG